MFKGLSNFASIIKQAREMGGRMEQIGEELKTKRTSATAGGGMVEVEVNGLQEVLACRIDPDFFSGGDREMLEDLLTAAVNQALSKAKSLHAEALQSATGGLDVPGLQEAMNKITGKTDEDSD